MVGELDPKCMTCGLRSVPSRQEKRDAAIKKLSEDVLIFV
jgi:hypothetical protein